MKITNKNISFGINIACFWFTKNTSLKDSFVQESDWTACAVVLTDQKEPFVQESVLNDWTSLVWMEKSSIWACHKICHFLEFIWDQGYIKPLRLVVNHFLGFMTPSLHNIFIYPEQVKTGTCWNEVRWVLAPSCVLPLCNLPSFFLLFQTVSSVLLCTLLLLALCSSWQPFRVASSAIGLSTASTEMLHTGCEEKENNNKKDSSLKNEQIKSLKPHKSE